MRESTAHALINLGTAALGVACVVVSALVPATTGVLGPLGGTLIGMAMKQPSAMLPRKRMFPPEPPTAKPEAK